ncbi:oligosaccharide repeat unit polymerase [bacterium]|nr:MAG: oligosaccharide repeat unit polymerase [bacterium]
MTELLLLLIVVVPVFSLYKEWKDRGGWYFLNPINSFWLTFIYAGAVQPALARADWVSFYSEEVLNLTLGMFLVLGLAVHVGYHSATGPQWSTRIPNLKTPDLKKVFWCGLILLGIGLIGYALVIQASGGWARWSASPRRFTDYSLSGYIYTMPRVATLGIMVLLCYAFAQEKRLPLKISVLALGVVNLFWQIYSGTREGTIVMLIILVGSIYGARRRNPPWIALFATFAATFFFFGFIPTYRGEFRNLSFNVEESPDEVVERSFSFFSGDDTKPHPDLWTDFGMAISVAYYVPSRLDYDYGQMLLEIFTRPIPRALWPTKSYPEGEAWDRFHRVSGVSTITNGAGLLSGPSPSMVGKYYYIGGWLGLVIGGYLVGVIFRALWEFLQRNVHTVIGATFSVATAGLGAMEMIHPLSWSVNFWLPTIAFPFFVMSYLVRQTEPAKDSQKSPPERQEPTSRPMPHAN